MPRTAVTVTPLPVDTATADVSDTAIDATNSHVITPPAGVADEELLLRITNTTASTKVATVKAGVSPPAIASGQGDLTVSLAAGNVTPTVKWVRVSSGRFSQKDGTVNVDIASSMTGTIGAFTTPRHG
jgi:hypothetical protein